jgi:hypothetical protein
MKVLNNLEANVVYYDSEILQEALQGIGSLTGLNASTIQEAIDVLFRLVLPMINFVGGAPATTNDQYLVFIDGGSPSTSEFIEELDGGTPDPTFVA